MILCQEKLVALRGFEPRTRLPIQPPGTETTELPRYWREDAYAVDVEAERHVIDVEASRREVILEPILFKP